MRIRPAAQSDATAIAAIANPIVRQTTITFTTEEKTPAGVAAQIASGQPYWVVEEGDGVVGFATHFPFRHGPGYARTREHTILFAPEARGRGAGRALIATVAAHAAGQGVHSLIAGVSGENAPGIAFHARVGFAEIARLPQVGHKFGRWLDLVLMQKILSDPTHPG